MSTLTWTTSTTGGTASTGWYSTRGITATSSSLTNTAWLDYDTGVLSVSPDIERVLRAGRSYDLPDGSRIEIDDDGNYNVIDADAKVIYKACRILAFNRFLNASELLEQFIADLAPFGVKQSQVLKIPVEAFISWLITKAALADGDEPPPRRHPHRCIQCKRFLPVRLIAQGINVCSPAHLERYFAARALPSRI